MRNKDNGTKKKSEFDKVYFRIYIDFVKLSKNNFGAKGEKVEEYKDKIKSLNDKIEKIIIEMGIYIRIANSLFPKYQSELEERRIAQEKAIGLCYSLLTVYQLAMYVFEVPDDKYTNEIKNIIHEINCLKSWRTSDNKRFVNLG